MYLQHQNLIARLQSPQTPGRLLTFCVTSISILAKEKATHSSSQMNELQAVRSKGCRFATKIIRPSKLQSSLDLIGPFLLFGFQEVKRLTNHQPTTKHTTNKQLKKWTPLYLFRDFEVKKPMDLQVSMLAFFVGNVSENTAATLGDPDTPLVRDATT